MLTRVFIVHGADSSRIRCGVVAFNPDGSVWMVAAKTEGWILPKGGYDQDQDHNMIECVQREAMEEAGLTLSSIYPLDLDEGTLHWYTAKVTADGPRTDKNLDEEKRPLPRPVKVPQAWNALREGNQKKKATMHRALSAALSFWKSVSIGEC